ncbi:g1394 [Coccomyxa viridis]|uniref:G1394 protein n=1 Tax=Coccomyxa viridis TaxID=1274662 RepID=A0ABP1FPP7_9CHLO
MAAAAASSANGPLATSIRKKLQDALAPSTLKVVNESHLHAGHMGNPDGAPDAETHFKVEVVSSEFKGQSMIQCHRTVYSLLDEELKNGVHALSLRTKAS